jgi:hypothetical protein
MDAGCELLAPASSNGYGLTMQGDFELGISRVVSGSLNLRVSVTILLARAQKQIEWMTIHHQDATACKVSTVE